MTAVDDVAWDLEPLLQGRAVTALLDEAAAVAQELETARGTVASMDATALAGWMARQSELHDLLGRAGSYAQLQFSVATNDAAIAAQMQAVSERSTAIVQPLVFFDLEWAALDDARVTELLTDEQLAFCAFHLRSLRRYRPHLLSEAEEILDTDKDQTGRSAWVRLFNELTGRITVELPTGTGGLEAGLALLAHPDRQLRQQAAAAVTEGLAPDLRTRAYVYNTLALDRSISDRVRNYDTWISSWNLSNQASDASVDALVEAVRARYDLPQRWYRLKARLLGLPKLADYDRNASVVASEATYDWDRATSIVLDSYRSFSGELADVVERFVGERWIDAPLRPGKRPGAFCSYTVPGHHPYLFLNWTSRVQDVLTLAHELGHGLHGYLARPQGVYHQFTPLTVAETASVFGETVTFNRLLSITTDPSERLALLANQVEGAIGTVFRQVAMNRFEHAVHTTRRTEGELSVDRFGELWFDTQSEMFGDTIEISEGYRTWWSYIPHFIATPGYVYAYAYGQLLALSVYQRSTEAGPEFVDRYLAMLSAGGSRSPEELGAMVDCDLTDPGFWASGLAIVEAQITAAEQAAAAAGR